MFIIKLYMFIKIKHKLILTFSRSSKNGEQNKNLNKIK